MDEQTYRAMRAAIVDRLTHAKDWDECVVRAEVCQIIASHAISAIGPFLARIEADARNGEVA